MTQLINLVGRTFSRLTVIARAPSKNGKTFWRCQCACGNESVAYSSQILSGHTRSCGCLYREKAYLLNRSHGMSKTPVYRQWCAMITRCTNPNQRSAAFYNALELCEEFRTFETFYAILGAPPAGQRMTIGRIDNLKGYVLGNVRWETYKTQGRNKRNNRLMTLAGVTKCQSEWTEELGISQSNLNARLRRGWTDEEALTMPVGSYLERHQTHLRHANASAERIRKS